MVDENNVVNAADESAVKNSKAKAKREDGLLVFHDLLQKAGVYRISFTGNSSTFFNEGKRSLGLELLEMMENSKPESLIKIIKLKQEVKNV